jgi:MFS family permease
MNKPGAGTLSRDFWKLWSAPAVSNVGDGIRLTALPHLIAAITRDPVVVSGVTAATFAPWLLLSLPGGAIVDRVNRRALIIVFQSVRACVGGNPRSGGDDGCGVTSLLPQLMFPWASAPHDANTDLQRIEGETFALRAALELLGEAARVYSSRVAIVGHDFGAMHGALLSAGSDPACV